MSVAAVPWAASRCTLGPAGGSPAWASRLPGRVSLHRIAADSTGSLLRMDDETPNEVDELVMRRAHATGRPVVAVGFTNADGYRVRDLDDDGHLSPGIRVPRQEPGQPAPDDADIATPEDA